MVPSVVQKMLGNSTGLQNASVYISRLITTSTHHLFTHSKNQTKSSVPSSTNQQWLVKDPKVKKGSLHMTVNPSDYEALDGKNLQTDVFDTLSKVQLTMETTGNVSAFLSAWKNRGLKEALDSVRLKYQLPTDKSLKEALMQRQVDQINKNVDKIVKHLALGVDAVTLSEDDAATAKAKKGPPSQEKEKEGKDKQDDEDDADGGKDSKKTDDNGTEEEEEVEDDEEEEDTDGNSSNGNGY